MCGAIHHNHRRRRPILRPLKDEELTQRSPITPALNQTFSSYISANFFIAPLSSAVIDCASLGTRSVFSTRPPLICSTDYTTCPTLLLSLNLNEKISHTRLHALKFMPPRSCLSTLRVSFFVPPLGADNFFSSFFVPPTWEERRNGSAPGFMHHGIEKVKAIDRKKN